MIPNRRRRKSGLTVLEILFAVLLLTCCVVFVVTIMIGLFRSSTKGEDQTVALELADKLLTQISAADASRWDELINDPNLLYTHDPAVATQFKAELQKQFLYELSMGDVYDVTVTISWWADAAGSNQRRDYGRQTLSLRRTVYVESNQP